MIKIDVVCPLYKASKNIEKLIGDIRLQKDVVVNRMVFAVTECDDSAETISALEKEGALWFLVKKEEFSHSLTREKAITEYCESDVVIMISQDIVFLNENAFYTLAKEISGKTVYAFGRQTAKKNTIEHYIRESNYGKEDIVVTESDIDKMQIKAFFASDAFSAYFRPTFLDLNGYDERHMMMNEDMYYARKVLLNGYEKKYVAGAVVEHSHDYKFRQLYNRYYETGKWFHDNPEFNQYKVTESGFKLATSVLKKALKDFNIPVLFKFLPNMTARFLGMKKGQKWDKKV